MRVKLTEIPKEIRERYNIAEEVICEVDESVGGGAFFLKNLNMSWITIDAVELTGTGIMVQEL